MGTNHFGTDRIILLGVGLMPTRILIVLILLTINIKAEGFTVSCGGIFETAAQAIASEPPGLPNASSECGQFGKAACGLPSSHSSASATWVFPAMPPDDNESDVFCAFELFPLTACPDLQFTDPTTGLCPGTVEQQPGTGPDCASNAGQQGYYSCTRSTIEQATSCAEGASTPAGCELDTTVNPTPPQCTQTGTPVSQGGSGTSFTCVVDLTQTGNEIPAGGGVEQVDSDNPTTTETGDVETGTSDDGQGCTSTSTTQTQITNNGDGTLTNCQVTTTVTTGSSCSTAGTTTSENCTTGFNDGSNTNTQTNTTQDSGGNTTGTTTTTTNSSGPEPTEEEADEGTLSGGGDCNTPPVCDGDVLLCGVISQEYQARCDFVDSLDDFVPDAGGDVVETDEVDIGAEVQSILNTSGFISNRTCPTVPSVTLFGTQVTWDFTFLCELYSILSYLVLAFASYRSFRIFMGAF